MHNFYVQLFYLIANNFNDGCLPILSCKCSYLAADCVQLQTNTRLLKKYSYEQSNFTVSIYIYSPFFYLAKLN